MTRGARQANVPNPDPAEPTMRTTARLLLVPLLAMPLLAEANCYSMFDSENHLSFQSTVPPVDLSMRISDAMAQRFPGRHLIITPDTTDCREVRASREPVRPRARPGQPAPMLTNIGPDDGSGRDAVPAPRRTRTRR